MQLVMIAVIGTFWQATTRELYDKIEIEQASIFASWAPFLFITFLLCQLTWDYHVLSRSSLIIMNMYSVISTLIPLWNSSQLLKTTHIKSLPHRGQHETNSSSMLQHKNRSVFYEEHKSYKKSLIKLIMNPF